MKILIVEPCFENFGGYYRAFGIAKALSSDGKHQVDLLLSSDKKFSLKIEKKKISDNLYQYSLPHIYINFFINGRILRGIIASFFILFKQYDIIHLFALIQFESNIPLLIFSKFLKRKIVIDWDDYWTGIHETIPFYKEKFGGVITKYFKFCEYNLQKLAYYATATSDFLIEEYRKIGIGKSMKLINCVNKDEFHVMDKMKARDILGIPSDEKMLLTFGNTYFKERTIYLFRFLELILSKDKSVKLYMNHNPKQLINEYARGDLFDERIFQNIATLGYLDKPKLGLYLSASDAVLFMMGETTYEKACFPIRVGAYLNGENVIITNETDTEAHNTLKKYDCVISDRDIEKLSEKTVYFLNNEIEKKRMKKNVCIAKEELSWENQIKRLEDFYERINK